MKTTIKRTLALLLALLCLSALFACGKDISDPWEDATYKEDTALGSGSNAVTVNVKVGEHKVTFTIKTDKKTVGEALMELGLLEGDEGDYGLYVKKVNGITADYDKDQTYWALYIDGEYAMTGVDTTNISEGTVYTLERKK